MAQRQGTSPAAAGMRRAIAHDQTLRSTLHICLGTVSRHGKELRQEATLSDQ